MLRIIKMTNFVNGYIIQNNANYDNNNIKCGGRE